MAENDNIPTSASEAPTEPDLEAEERELMERLRALRERKAEAARAAEEAKKLAEAVKPINVHVMLLTGTSLIVQAPFRQDLLNVWQSTQGRTYNSEGRNGIPVSQWEATVARIKALPNVTVTYAPGVEQDIEWWTKAPPWEIVVHPSGRHLIAKMGPRINNRWIFNGVPGADWDESSKSWKLPLSEGWRIAQALQNVEGVVYDPDAAELIFAQVKKRSRLDEIVKKDSSDFVKTHLPELAARLEADGVPNRPFQDVGIEFGYESLTTDDEGGGFLLADDTGLGKSRQSLIMALLLRKLKDPTAMTLIVSKAANIPGWRHEVEYITGFKPLVLYGGKPDGTDIIKILNKTCPFVMISYDTLGTYQTIPDDNGIDQDVYLWANVLKNAGFSFVICDEAKSIKTPDTHRSFATRMLAPKIKWRMPMDATPVMSRTAEMWAPLYVTDPITFKVHDQFLRNYTINGKIPINTGELHDLLRPRFLRRKKTDVIKDLPPINRITLFHDLSPKGLKLYNMVMNGIYEELEEFDTKGIGGTQMNVMSILAQITRLKQICAADKAKNFTPDLAQSLVDQEGGEGKVLIFSQFKATALSIARQLGHEALCTVKQTDKGFVSLDPEQRHVIFEQARNDENIHYIVTTEAAREGHNLQYCDWVIFNDLLWTPAAHDQCEGRAYGRLANPHTIDSYYIVAEAQGSEWQIEKWIVELLTKKLAIIQAAVENIEGSRDADISVANELIAKMREVMWTKGYRKSRAG